MSFGENRIVGDYECLAVIDKPRAGVTYKVRNRRTGELEALRALTGSAAGDPESVERLLREMRVHARLTHPNLVAFHDAFELDGQLVMTTDYVDGPSLAQRCAAGPLPPDDAVSLVVQVLRGLEQAHDLGIVHRGITADHIVLAADGSIKLGGFDLAKPASDANLTKVGAVMGDPRYVSPEQVAGKPPADGRSDLYAVGVVLYLALTGKPPFDGSTDFEILSAQLSAPPVPPSRLNPAIPAALEAVVLQALKKNPDERFATCAEFETALALAEAEYAPRPAETRETARTDAAAPPPGRKMTTPAIAGIAAAALALAGGLWFALR